jgi:diguanylate cyclase (GGDEF)-like protein
MKIGFESQDFSGMSVMIIDDRPENIQIVGHFLKQAGLNISVAPNAEVAEQLLAKVKPDLILLDVMLPGIDGFQFCEKLKTDDQTKDIPIIFITIKSDIHDLIRGFEVGGIDYIEKPFQELEVLVRTKNQLSKIKLNKEKKELIKKLDSISRIDLQLGISNRRDIIEILKKSQSRVERFGQGFSVIVGDIDNFKKINDQGGQEEGDGVLKKITETLKKKLREADYLGRWGEDEFLIVLPETPIEGAANVAESIRKSIQGEKFEVAGKAVSLTISFGVSCQFGKGMTLDELLKTANANLHLAKEGGKNQVVSS